MDSSYKPTPRWKEIYNTVLVVLMIAMVIFLLISLFFYPHLFPIPIAGILLLGVLRKTFNQRQLMVLAMLLAAFIMLVGGVEIFKDDFFYFNQPADINTAYERYLHNLTAYPTLKLATYIFIFGFLLFFVALFWDIIYAKLFRKK
ncbi:MAG: hypothetical protein CMN32_13330 [Saprospirales bacterium]|nr:hypothetical protein [Saprospirales bacterium]